MVESILIGSSGCREPLGAHLADECRRPAALALNDCTARGFAGVSTGRMDEGAVWDAGHAGAAGQAAFSGDAGHAGAVGTGATNKSGMIR